MRLTDLFKEVEEKNLTKTQLEDYYSELSQLMSQIAMETADLQKKEAMFMTENAHKSVAQRKIEWNGTEAGQRLIDLKQFKIASGRVLDSIKTRIYAKL